MKRALLYGTLGAVAGAIPLVGGITNAAAGMAGGALLGRKANDPLVEYAAAVAGGVGGFGLNFIGSVTAFVTRPSTPAGLILSAAFGGFAWAVVGYLRDQREF
ncbi:MAG: hypothetical protein AB1758_04735 [Candidatus Eremiobacterota bacterium]